MIRSAFVLLLFISPLCGATLEEKIDSVVQRWEAPAVAVAVVHADQVTLEKGYGKARPETFFQAGSMTKALTCASLALLVEEGKIRWDDSVSRHLPSFQPKDPYFARNLTIADLVSHRAGLGSGQGNLLLIRYGGKESLRYIAQLQPEHPFRTRYAYQNVYYTVAGELIEKVSGIPYEAFVEQRILEPLGMRKSGMRKRASVPPHIKEGEKVVKTDLFPLPGGVAAGGLVSNLEEMVLWVKEMLDPKILGPKSHQTLLSPHTVIPRDDYIYATHPGVGLMNYGLGWVLYDWEGEPVAEHGGRYPGYSCRVLLLPRKKVGIVVMCNQHETFLPLAVCYTVMEHLTGGKERDWGRIYSVIEREVEKQNQEHFKAFVAARVGGTTPSHPLEDFIGSYDHPAYGQLEVEQKKDQLLIGYGEVRGVLNHWHHDTFVVEWTSDGAKGAIGRLPVNFVLDHEGRVSTLRFADEIPFKRS